MKLSVIGTGYLGAVHAAGMASLGHEVIGVDPDLSKIMALSEGRAPFFEPHLEQLLDEGVRSGRLTFSTRIEDAVERADVHFVCVGTPQVAGSDQADLSVLEAVMRDLARLATRECLVVGKSTVPVGTAQRLQRDVLATADVPIRLAWNPEFLREGFAVEDTLHPDRLVFGVADHVEPGPGDAPDGPDATLLRELYRTPLAEGSACVVTDFHTAELVKVAANSFLATKISFINAMADVCEVVGADVVTLADAIGYDARIGRKFLNAGVGFGGGCLGKDIRAFRARGEELGVGRSLRFLAEVDDINERRRQHVVQMSHALLPDGLEGARIVVLGAAFKPNSDDVRDSPALAVATQLVEAGADVRVHDPIAIENARRAVPQVQYVHDLADAFDDADLVIHLTEWSMYRSLDPAALAATVRRPVLLDARNVLDPEPWTSAGWQVHGLGRHHTQIPAHPVDHTRFDAEEVTAS